MGDWMSPEPTSQLMTGAINGPLLVIDFELALLLWSVGRQAQGSTFGTPK